MAFDPEVYPQLRFLDIDTLQDVSASSELLHCPGGQQILAEGQYVRVVPIVLSGLVRVFIRQEHKELLLYYIQPNESCVMSFTAVLQGGRSKIFAITETDSTILLLPAEKIPAWLTVSASLNRLFYGQFDQRYLDLLDTIQHLLFDRLDKRLLLYLQQKTQITGKNLVSISHKTMAQDLGTAREVISRTMKKLEKEGCIRQEKEGIVFLGSGD